MKQTALEKKKFVPVSEAADYLGVSIDTIRRWDKSGILHSTRPNGKTRFFALEELEKVKFSKPLSISEASKQLGLSNSTLRRLEHKGIIKPERNGNGERIYTKESIEKFLNSEYFLRQKQVEEKILEPFKEPEADEEIPANIHETKERILSASLEKGRQKIHGLPQFIKALFLTGLFLGTITVLIVMIITVFFLVVPEETANFLGYRYQPASKPLATVQVLGDRTQISIGKSFFGGILRPFSNVALGVAKQIKPEISQKVVQVQQIQRIQDINDVFKMDDQGNIVPVAAIKLPDVSYLQVQTPDQSGQSGGSDQQSIPLVSEGGGGITLLQPDGTLPALKVTQTNLVSGSVTAEAIADGSITPAKLSDITRLSLSIIAKPLSSFQTSTCSKDQILSWNGSGLVCSDAKSIPGITANVSNDSVKSEHIKDGEVKEGDIAGGAVTSGKISDNTIDATDLAATLTFADGDFLNLAAIVHDDTAVQGLRLPNASSATPSNPTSGEGYIAWDTSGNQIITYDGSSWSTVSGGGGSGDITAVTAGSGLSGGGTSGAVSLAVSLTSSGTTGSSSSNSGLEVSSSGLTLLKGCSDNQTLTYTDAGGWTCANAGGGSQTPWTSNIDADNFLLLDLGTNITARAGLTVATTTTGSLTLDSGTTGTVNLGTGNNAKTINIGTGTAGNTINIGTDNTTLDTIVIGSALDSLALTDADWSIATAGLITTASDIAINGGDLTTTATTFNLVNTTATTVNFAGAATTLTIGATTGTATIRNATVDFSGGSATVSGNLALYGAARSIQTTALNTLTIGGTTTGNIVIDSGSSSVTLSDFSTNGGLLYTNASGILQQTGAGTSTTVLHGGTTPSYSAVSLTADVSGILPIANGGTNKALTLSAGAVAYTDSDSLELTAVGTSTQCLLGGTTPSFGSCGTGITIDTFWNQTSGALYPNNSTVDLLVGAQATASAKFAVLNINSGTPTASVSASSGNNATTLTGAGVLGTTNAQTLTLGNSSTGEVLLSPGGTLSLTARGANLIAAGTLTGLTGLTVASGTVSLPSGQIDNIELANSSISVSATGGTGILVTGSPVSLGGTLTLAGIDASTSVKGVASFNTANFAVSGGDVTIKAGGVAAAEIAANTIDFADISDNPTLDGTTTIALGTGTQNFNLVLGTNATNGNIIIQPNAGGQAALIIDKKGINDIFTASASGATKFTVNNSGDLVFGSTTRLTNAGVGTFITGTVIGSQTFTTNNITDSGALTITSTTNALTLDSGSGSIALSSDSLTGVGTGITANAALTVNTGTTGALTLRTADQSGGSTNSTALNILTGNAAGVTSTAGNIVLDVGTSTTSNGSINIGTAARTQTINIGTNATGGVITIGSATNTGLILSDAQWSVTDAGAAAFASVSEGGTGLSAKYAPIAANFVTVTSNATLTGETGIDALTTAVSTTSTLNVDGASTLAGVTMDAGSSFTMTSGTGLFAQTHAVTTDATADAHTITLSAGGTGEAGALRGLVISQSDTGASGVYDSLASIINLKTPETTTNGLLIEQNAASGTLTNGLNVTSTAGTITSGILIADGAGTITDGLTLTGTFTNLVNTPNFDVNNAGNITVAAAEGLDTNTAGTLEIGLTNANALTIARTGVTTTVNGALTVTETATANGILDANGVVTLGDGGDAITIDSNALILQTTGAGSDITINAVDQVILTDFTTCTALETVANVLTCGTDDTGGGGTNFWQTNNGALAPGNETVDLLVGATATSSAEFAILNINSGTPVASVSAVGATNRPGISVGGDGVIQSVNLGTLTLGGSTTGNIVIDSGSSVITLSDATTANSTLTVTGTTTANGTLTANGVVTLGDNGDTVAINSSDWDITTVGDATGIGALTMDGNFSQTGATTFSTGTGAVSVNGAATFISDVVFTFVGGTEEFTATADPGADTALTAYSFSIDAEDTIGSDEAQVGLALVQSSNGADVTEAADALLTLTNNDANDPVNVGIRFDAGAANAPDFADGLSFDLADLTREIVLENAEAIINQTDDTITFEDDDGTDYATLTATALTVTGDLAITGGNITSAVTADSTLTATGTLTANGTLDANGVVTLGDGGDAITIDSNALILQTTGAGSDITINAVDQVILTDFTTCTALETVANVLTCGTDDTGGGGGSNWRISSGALSPINDTLDLLIGNIASTSARFAVLNVNSGTPTASASAGVAGATYFTAGGTIQTTAAQTLTLGGSTTGNIVIDSSDWDITSTGAMTGIGAITADGLITGTGGLTLTGATAIAIGNNLSTVAIDSSDWDISATGAMTGIGAITADGLITGSGGLTLTGATAIAIGNNLSTVAIDSSDWDISTTGAMTGIGAITSDGAISTTSTLNADGATTLAALTLDAGSNFVMTSGTGTFAQTNAQTTDATADAMTLTLSAGGTGETGTLRGLVVSQSDTATTGVYDSLASIINLKTPETTTNGLLIGQNAASGTLTNAINILETAGTVTNGLRFGTNILNDILFATDSTHILQVEAQDTAATAGSDLQILGATGNTSGAGGGLILTAGQGGATGVGGVLTFTTGAGGGTSGNSGALTVLTGNTTSGTAGNISIDVGTSTTSNGSINIGTAARNQTITIGSTGNTSAVTVNSGVTTTTALTLNANSATTGTALLIKADALAGGFGLDIQSGSTGGGDLLRLVANAAYTGDLAIFQGGSMTGRGLYINGGGATSNPAARIESGSRTGPTLELVGGVSESSAISISGSTTDITSGNAENLSIISGSVGGSLTLKSGNETGASQNSGAVTIASGNAAGATSTAGNVVLDVGTSTTSNGSINIGTAARTQTINIGTNATGGVMTIGSATNTGLVLSDAQWSVTDAGAAAFASVSEGGTGLSAKYAPIGANFVTVTSNATLTGETGIDALSTAVSTSSTLNVDGASTLAGVTMDAGSSFIMLSGAGTFAQTNAQTTDASADAHTITLSAGGTGEAGALRGLVISQSDTATTGVYDSLASIINLKTPETTTNGLLIQQNAASGTLTNAINILQTAGTITNAINANGTLISLAELQILDANISLTTEVTGTLPLANGGTNATTAQGAINNIAGLTTEGDILYRDATNATRLARGADGQCLTANTTTIIWGSCAAGATDTLQTVYNAASGNTITTTTGRNITLTLADVATPTELTISNLDTAGTNAVQIDNGIASGTLTNGLLIEESGAGTMTNAIQVAGTAGAITSGILIADGAGTITDGVAMTGTFTNLINTPNFDVNNAGNITVAAAEGLDTNGAGALELGKANATSVDLCNSANCDTIDIGNLATTDADTITIGDALDNVSITDANWSITGAGALTVTSCSGCGGATTKYLNTQHDIASTTATEVTGISTTLTAGTYAFTYSLIVRSGTATVGMGFGINYTGTTTKFVARERFIGTGTTASTGILDDANTGVLSEQINEGATTRTLSTTAPNLNVIGDVTTINVDNYVTIEGVIVVSNGGDIGLWHNSDSAATTSVMTGSSVVIQPITVGADLAEIYSTMDPDMGPGDVVSLDPGLRSGVKKSDKPYDKNVFGIVSTSPSLVMGSLEDSGADPVLVAMSGRVPVKVTTENGPIRFGDLLTSSSTPGVAMRATKAGQIIGQAMTEFDGEGIGKVMAFVKTDYANGAKIADLLPGLSTDETVDSPSIGATILEYFLTQKQQLAASVDLSEIVTDKLAAGVEVITPKVVASEVNLDKISASTGKDISLNLTKDGKFIIKDEESNNAIVFDAQGNAFFKGEVRADRVKANQIEGLEVITDKVTKLSQDTHALINQHLGDEASTSAQIAGVSTSSEQESVNKNTLDQMTINGALTVVGPSEFREKSIFQALAEFIGQVIFRGNVEFLGNVKHLADVTFQGRPTFNKDTAGFAVIKKDVNIAAVVFEKEYETTPVVNVSVSLDFDPDGKTDEEKRLQEETEQKVLEGDIRYIVTKKTKKGFIIKLNKKAETDIYFSWSAISVKDAKTSLSNPAAPVVASEQTPTSTPAAKLTPEPTPSSTPSPTTEPAIVSVSDPKTTVTVLENELGFLRVREDASSESLELGQVSPGQTFEVKEEKDGWYKIEFESGKLGWVSGAYIN